jgi:HNH endonuclease
MSNSYSNHPCIQCKSPTLNPKFCSRSCAATYNNTIQPKRSRANDYYFCVSCEKPQRKRSLTGLCQSCRSTEQDRQAGEMTLGQSIKNFANPRSRYNTVRHHGRKLSNLYSKCQVCGYSNVLETAHIKGISEFSLDTQIKTINHPDNIAILCPNHHAELDRGLLQISDIPPRGFFR